MREVSSGLFGIAIILIFIVGASYLFQAVVENRGQVAYPPHEFEGNLNDYISWLVSATHVYHIDDDTGLKPRSGVVNDAFLFLTVGSHAPSTFQYEVTVAQAYRDQMLAFVSENYDFTGDRDRVLTSIAESYMYMKKEKLFNLSEQQELEIFFLQWAKVNKAEEDYGHQFAPHALAAVTSYVLETSETEVNHSSDIRDLRSYAFNNSLDFGETYGPIENSAHYSPFIFISMLRISLYSNNGVFPDKHKPNLKKAVEWMLDVYPHNGFGLSFGETWSSDHVRQSFCFLIAAAGILNDGTAENVLTAQNAKWLSNKLFSYGLDHRHTYENINWENEWMGGVRGEPMLIYMFADDSLVSRRPDLVKHGSKSILAEFGDSYNAELPHVLKSDKIVHRDGWGKDSFYLLIDMAPTSGKTAPYANSIVNFIYGNEAFSSGKTRDRYHLVWEKRNVVAPASSHIEATIGFMEDFEYASFSKTIVGDWERYVVFVKDNSYAVVFDFAASAGTAYWHLQGGATWHSDYVELQRGNYQLHVYYPNTFNWYSVSHHTSYETDSGGRCIWYSGTSSIELELSNARTWATVLYPFRGEIPVVTAIQPAKDGFDIGADAVGTRLTHSTYTDWNGVSRGTNGRIEYDTITTDAETFSARNESRSWTISYVNGNSFEIQTDIKPNTVEIDGAILLTEGVDWHYSQGVLTITVLNKESGTIFVS